MHPYAYTPCTARNRVQNYKKNMKQQNEKPIILAKSFCVPSKCCKDIVNIFQFCVFWCFSFERKSCVANHLIISVL